MATKKTKKTTRKAYFHPKRKISDTRVFVYGTLKDGFHNHFLLERHNAAFVCEAKTIPNYVLVHLGGFPGMIDRQDGMSDDDCSIRGEVYNVNREGMKALDRLEGVGYGLYERKIVRLVGGKTAIAYFFLGKCKDRSIVPGGEWSTESREQRNTGMTHDEVMKKLAAMKVSEYEVSNFNIIFDSRLSADLQDNPGKVVATHFAWNFNGNIWFEDGKFHESVFVYHQLQKVVTADTIEDLVTAVNDEYGYE